MANQVQGDSVIKSALNQTGATLATFDPANAAGKEILATKASTSTPFSKGISESLPAGWLD